MAPDRILSVVDPEMRHGRKSSSQKFDGYKAHVSVQRGHGTRPRLVTRVTVTPGNTSNGDQTVAVLRSEGVTYGRGIGITPTEALTQAERARQAHPPWQTAYRQRPQVEHSIRGLTRGRDRATHYWGQRKTQMQRVWQAVGYNIRELFVYGQIEMVLRHFW